MLKRVKRWSIVSAVFSVMMASAATSQAACAPSDISGTWFVLVRFFSQEAPVAGWNNCSIRLDDSGVIQNSRCRDLDLGETVPTDAGDVFAGRFRLLASCRVRGNISIVGDDGPAFRIRGFVDRDVENMNGALFIPDVPNDIITFSGSKR